MHKQKRLNKNLIYILKSLYIKRSKLIQPFLDKDPELIGKTFKYERNQSAFKLVREYYQTLWIDSHFSQISLDEISDNLKNEYLWIITNWLSKVDRPCIQESSLQQKLLSDNIQILNEFLKQEDSMMIKLNKIKYAYEKDKALFEREFLKFEHKV